MFTLNEAKLLRASEYVGAVATLVIMILVAHPPRLLAALLPGFFFAVGLFCAYIVLAVTIVAVTWPQNAQVRAWWLAFNERGSVFLAIGLIVSAKGGGKVWSLSFIGASILLRVLSLRRANSALHSR